MNAFLQMPQHHFSFRRNLQRTQVCRLGLNLSTDEGSFDTRRLVAIWLLLVFNKLQRGRGLVQYLFGFVLNKAVY